MVSLDVLLWGFYIIMVFLIFQLTVSAIDKYNAFFIVDDLFGTPIIKPFGDELRITDSIESECNCIMPTGKVYIVK
jgi:hypothetical protein